MPHSAERLLPEPPDTGARETRPDLKLVPPPQEGDDPDDLKLWEDALARAQELEPTPASSPEHHEAIPESLINASYLRAARDQLVSAWADLRKYEHGLTGAVRGIVARKSKATAQAHYDAAQQAYQQALREQAHEVGREFGTIEKAKALVSAMEQMTDARAEVVIGKNELSRKMYQLWQKMGELNVGNIDAVKNILARQEDESAWKGKAKAVGRFIARGMSLRSAVGAAMVGSGFWFAYAGWRTASAAAGGAATHTLMREGMRVGSRELLKGSESKVRREYSEVELAGMDDKELGELMQAYGARLGFHGEKLQGNARFERVRNAFLSRLELVEGNVQDRIDLGWDTESRTPEEERALEAMMAKKDAMLERLDGLSQEVEQELATKEKEDRRQRLIAAASALAVSGAIMYWRSGGISNAEATMPIVHKEVAGAPIETPAVVGPSVEDATVVPPVETPAVVEPEAMAEAAPATAELPHGVAGVYEIKSGQGLLHAANEFQKAQHDEIVAGIKTQHPEWFAKGEDYAIRKWRLEQMREHGGDITAAGEKYTETLHKGAKIQLEFDDKGYPHLTAIEDKHITHHAEQLRPRVEAAPAAKPDLGFEKWTDDRPVAFHVGGVRGEAVLHMDPETGTPHVEMHHALVDPKEVDRFLDPGMEQALKEHLNLEGDPAALAVVKEQAYQLGEDLAAHEALLADLNLREVGDSPLAEAVRGRMREIVEETNARFGDAHVLRPVSLPPEEAAKAVASAPETTLHGEVTSKMLQKQVELNPAEVNPAKLVFPQDWTVAQQEAARRVMTYHQEMMGALEKQLDAYETGHAGDPLLEKLRENLSAAKAEALTEGDYSVHDMLQRIYKNNPGKIPAVELVSGTSTVAESARAEAGGIFDEWLKQ